MIALTTILIFIAGCAKGLMDRLMFHYHTMPKSWNEQFWNSYISWVNKWKLDPEGVTTDKPRFPGSTTFLVWLTDGWHLIQFVFLNCLFLALVCYEDFVGLNLIFEFIIYRFIFWVGFTLVYR